MINPPAIFSCDHIGISGTTRVHVHHIQTGKPALRIPDIFEARVGIAIMGYCNPGDSDPFSHKFRDNYARGFGTTQEQAIEALKADIKSTAESIWA
jgi:hypothetical protein